MLYLSDFNYVSIGREEGFLGGIQHTCYDSFYPFQVLAGRGLDQISFEPLTLFYGGNGSGKTSALNVIAEKIGAERDALFNCTNFFGDYLSMCRCEMTSRPSQMRIITSDDVFDFMLNLRGLNEGLDIKREKLFEEYMDAKHSKFQLQSLDDYDRLKMVNDSRRLTQSKYVRKNMMGNVREHSNGESAFLYFTQRMEDNGLYLLDEPENSLSPERQLELAKFIEDSVRFFGCQVIMATHSPFMLAMKGAKIYDFDEEPVKVKKWTELSNVRVYFDFFESNKNEFLME